MKYALVFLLAADFFYANDDGLPDARISANLIYSPETKTLLLIDGYSRKYKHNHQYIAIELCNIIYAYNENVIKYYYT